MKNTTFKENRLSLFMNLLLFSLIFVFIALLDSWIIYLNTYRFEWSPLLFFVLICNSFGIYSLFRNYLTLTLTQEGIKYSSLLKSGFIRYDLIEIFDLWHIRNNGPQASLMLANFLAKNTKNYDRKHIYIKSKTGEDINIDTALIYKGDSQFSLKDYRDDFITLVSEGSKKQITVNRKVGSKKFKMQRLLLILMTSVIIAFTYNAIFDIWSLIFFKIS